MDVHDIMNKIRNGNFQDVKRFIPKNPDKIDQTNLSGQTSLMVACEQGNIELINLLVDTGADLNMADRSHSTALHHAVWGRQLDALTTLITQGSDVNRKDINGYTPLHLAAEKGSEWKDGVAALLETQSKDVIQVNQRNNFGKTPLHLACSHGYADTVCLLINHTGIDANAVDNYGDTPLHLVVQRQHIDAMTFLLSQFSVKVDIRNCDNMTPLLEAVSRGHLGMIRKLIARGADVNAVNNEGSNCLHLAVKRTVFHSEYRPLCLLDKFCTELKLSKEKRLSGVVAACYLASKGADFYHKNYKSNAPLDLIENGNLKEKLRTFLLSRCMLCEVNEATVELQPCAHNAVCGECYTIKLKRCPKCRTCIKSKSKFDSLKMEENHFHSTAKILSVKQQQVVIPELNKKDLLMVAKRLGGKWQRAGIFLEIETYQLDVIKHDNPNDTVEQSFQMLYRWFTSCDPDTRTTKTLREALEEAECFDALKCLSSEEK